MRWGLSLLLAVIIVIASFVLMLIMITPATHEQQHQSVKIGQFIAMPTAEVEPVPVERPELPEPPPATEIPEVLQPPVEAVVDVSPKIESTVQVKVEPKKVIKQPVKEVKKTVVESLVKHTKARDAAEASAVSSTAPTSTKSSTSTSSKQVAANSSPEGPLPADDAEVRPINEVRANYPRSAQSRQIEGYVKLGFVITAKGTTRDIQILEASPKNVFDREARRVAALWRFTPRVQNGSAVEIRGVKTLTFKLQGKRR